MSATPEKRVVEASQSWAVPLSDLVVDAPILDAVHEAVSSGWWSMGPRVAEFENAFASFTGSRHALAVANGTAALHLALVASGCGPGDEVILPSLNFVAAANTIALTGAAPVFCDVLGVADLNLDPADVEAAITPATKALLVLHYGGHPCAMHEVLELAERHGLFVIEDAAHAPGATWRGRSCGTLGDVGCFSFFSNKNLPIGEGGMIVTDDDRLAERIRLLRSHGMTTLTWDRHRGHASSYDVVEHGFNYRLDEIRAAMGSSSWSACGSRTHAARASSRDTERGSQTRASSSRSRRPTDTRRTRERLRRNTSASSCCLKAFVPTQVRTALREDRIQTSMHYPPIHRFSLYAEQGRRRSLPITDDVASRLVTLPLFPHLRDDQVDLVVDRLLAAI